MAEAWGKNTKIFHSKATQQRRKNHIKGIKNAQDQWVEELEDVVKVASDHFDNLFCVGSCDQMEDFLSVVTSKVTTNMQEFYPVILQLKKSRWRCFEWDQPSLLDQMV